MNESAKKNKNPLSLERTVGFYAEKRKPVYILCIVLAVLALFCAWNVEVTDSLVAYMPAGTNSGAGYDIMTEEFTDLAEAQVLLENVSLTQCELVEETLGEIEGVYAVSFDESSYADGVGVFDITFAYGESPEAEAAYEAVKDAVSLFDGGVSSSLDSGWWWSIDFGMIFLMLASAVLLIIALVYASRTYADVWVMLITVGFAVIMNYGTSFGMAEVTSLTAAILHAALTMYYTALICRRYTRERKELDVRPAVIAAVVGSMPKVMAGGLIAVVALLVLAFARLQIGFNFALAMTKGVLITLVLCITLLPGLIVTFANRMEKSRHKALLPKIKSRCNLIFKTRYAFPIIFAVLAISALAFVIVYPAQPYAFGGEQLMPLVKSEGQMVEYRADRYFDKDTSEVYMIVPGDNYDAEEAAAEEIGNMVDVVSVTALSNSRAATYILTDEVNIHQFSDITGLDVTAVWNIYSDHSEAVGVEAAGGVDAYEVPFVEIFNYTYDRVQEGSLTVDSGVAETLDKIHYEMMGADSELWGESYDRIIIDVNMPEDPAQAAKLMENIRSVGENHYGETVYVTGDSGAVADLADADLRDTILITAGTVVLLIVLLAIMLKAPWTAVILVLMIQGGVWLTMAVPYIFPGKLIHIGGMLGYTIQMIMGVTYAAALANSYKKFKAEMPLKKAAGQAFKENHSLIVVTGCLLILSGLVLGFLSFDETAMAVGFTVAIGGVVNMLLATIIIPQTLLAVSIVDSKITKSDVDITGEPPVPVEERMDIVEAIERLKAAEQQNEKTIVAEQQNEKTIVAEQQNEKTIVAEQQNEKTIVAEQQTEETIIPEKEGEQTDETEK